MTTPLDGPTYLYRAYDTQNRLLYVGIAVNWGRRWAQHSERSPWFVHVARLDLALHPTREAARDAERRAVQDEKPLHNIEHTDRDPRRRWTRRPSTRTEHNVLGFDHRDWFGSPQYHAVASAIDAMAQACQQEETTALEFERLLINLARSVRYGDCCSGCYEIRYPIDVHIEGASLTASYWCEECANPWRCGWAVDIHRIMS